MLDGTIHCRWVLAYVVDFEDIQIYRVLLQILSLRIHYMFDLNHFIVEEGGK